MRAETRMLRVSIYREYSRQMTTQGVYPQEKIAKCRRDITIKVLPANLMKAMRNILGLVFGFAIAFVIVYVVNT